MYLFNFHHVEADCRNESRKHITISPQGLRQFIRLLRQSGLEIVSLRDILAGGGLPAHHASQALITFDDGYRNFYTDAVPVLEAERCPATMFVLAGLFSGNNHWDQGDLAEADRDALMSVDELKQVAQSGLITYGSHGLRHDDYVHLDAATLTRDLAESYDILSKTLGSAFLPVQAYPYGCYDKHVLEAMIGSPYRYGFTTEKGTWEPETPPFCIPRYSVYHRDANPLILAAKLLKIRLFKR